MHEAIKGMLSRTLHCLDIQRYVNIDLSASLCKTEYPSGETPVSYILLVEDEALIAALMSKKLEDIAREKVVVCKNLEQASERLTEGLPKLAFLDVNLENKMCFGLASDLQLQGVPIFFLTSYSLQSLRNLGLPQHLEDVEIISKSTASQTLADIIRANSSSKPAEVGSAPQSSLRT